MAKKKKRSGRPQQPKAPIADRSVKTSSARRKKKLTLSFWKDKAAMIALGACILATALAYWPSTENGFTNWDDLMYVVENENLELNSESFGSMLTEKVAANIHPVTMISLAFDYTYLMPDEIDPVTERKVAHAPTIHRMSLFYHILGVFFFFWFTYLISGRSWIAAFLVAGMFGLHPMHVESVAWVSGRKDVLYGALFGVALVSYMYFKKDTSWWKYALCLVLFFLACFAKAMAVILPLILLLIDWYEGRKIDMKNLLEKLPFFAIALFAGIVAYNAQASTTSVADFDRFGIVERFLFACFGMNTYIWKFILPVNLSAFYPYPIGDLPSYFYLAPVFSFAIAGCAIWALKKTKIPFFGLAFAAVSVVLVLQFVAVGDALMADRYSYLLYIGLALIPALFLSKILKSDDSKKPLLAGLIGLVLVVFGLMTMQRSEAWANSGNLWQDVVDKYPYSYTGYHNLGHYYRTDGDNDTLSLQAYNKAIELKSDYFEALANRGAIYRDMGMVDKAIEDYNKALKVHPKYVQALSNRANAYFEQNRFDEALADYTTALNIEPNNINAISNQAATKLKYAQRLKGDKKMKMFESCVLDYDKALTANPGNSLFLSYRGFAHYNLNNLNKAMADFNKALQIDSGSGQIYYYRGYTYLKMGNLEAAQQDAKRAIQNGVGATALQRDINLSLNANNGQ